jgi:ParB-like chromosome segregation protein Spo0J
MMIEPERGEGRIKNKMNVFDIAIGELIPYDRNLRKNDRAVVRMVASIKEFGFKIPLLARRRGEGIEVVDGELRLKAARKLKMQAAPVAPTNFKRRRSACAHS